ANAAFVRKLLAALVDSSPEALDTLNELAVALGNDPEFATTIMNALAGKQPLSDVLTAISNLEERADNLLCFNQDGNASLSPLSEKARSLLAQATVETMRNELELKSAAVRDIQTDLYDSSEGRVALPGAFGYGMTDAGARSIIASDMATVARTAHNVHPGRYYTFSTQTEETTGITEIIWLDNGWGDKTSQTATKLVLFFGKDGRILMTVRGDNISAPVTWTNLTPQLGNAAQKDAQENIYDRTEGRLAIPGMFGFGKVFSSGDRTEFKTEADFLRWVKTAKPGRYAVYADTNAVIQGVLFKGTVEIIWPESQPNPNPAYVAKIIIFYGINGHIYYNRYWTSGDGYLVGWENVKFSLTAKDVALWLSKYTYPAYEPDIGALVQAAYSPTSNPGNLPLKYGINYSGSYLHPYVFSAPVNGGSAEIHITEDKFLPGTYRGLVNYPELQTEDYMLGLFVRFA
ncbi:TPA: phage tail protein, partial [Escherichia coli]|nr:phage tail protein [Escherichia coli]